MEDYDGFDPQRQRTAPSMRSPDLLFTLPGRTGKAQVEVQLGPFASCALRKVATAIQKCMVLWSIAMFGLSFPKMQTIETYTDMYILHTRIEELHESEPDICFCRGVLVSDACNNEPSEMRS